MRGEKSSVLRIIDQLQPERADAQRNRDRILAAARALLRTRAIADICMDDLARKAGVGKGTLYRRFGDRPALIRALLDEDERTLQERILRGSGLGKSAPPLARLLAVVHLLATHVLSHADMLLEISMLTTGPARYEHPVRHSYRYEIRRLLAARGRHSEDELDFVADAILALLEPEFLVWQKAQLGPRRLFAWLAVAAERLAG